MSTSVTTYSKENKLQKTIFHKDTEQFFFIICLKVSLITVFDLIIKFSLKLMSSLITRMNNIRKINFCYVLQKSSKSSKFRLSSKYLYIQGYTESSTSRILSKSSNSDIIKVSLYLRSERFANQGSFKLFCSELHLYLSFGHLTVGHRNIFIYLYIYRP